MSERIDLGSDHSMQWYVKYGDPEIRTGITVWHPLTPQCGQSCKDLGMCGGAVAFDIYDNKDVSRPKWRVTSMNPLTLSPSLLCHCGDHGFIIEGRWVPA